MDKNVELVRLNELWCVVDDPLQWILRRRGKKNGTAGPWRPRSFCATRKALLRCIREYCADVDPAAVAFVSSWPERHAPGVVVPMVEARQGGVIVDCLKKPGSADAAQALPQSDVGLSGTLGHPKPRADSVRRLTTATGESALPGEAG